MTIFCLRPFVNPGPGFFESSLTGAYNYPQEPDTLDIDPPQFDTEYSDDQVDSDKGEISLDKLRI